MDATKAEDEKLILCIWGEKLSFQQFQLSTLFNLFSSRNTTGNNSAEVDGFIPNLVILFKWHFLWENYLVWNFPVGFK